MPKLIKTPTDKPGAIKRKGFNAAAVFTLTEK